MLSAPDAAIVARDPDLPGLGILLDPPALLEILSEAFPGMSGSGVRVEYLRYKAGTSCLASFQVQTPQGPIGGYAKAFKRGRHEKLRHWRTETSADDRAHPQRRVSHRWDIGISFFPDDRRLKALRRLTDPSVAARVIAAAQGEPPETDASVELATLRYKPERRYVASVAHGGTIVSVLKAYDEPGYRNGRAGAGLFEPREALRIPRCRGESATHRLLLFEWMSGRSLHEELTGAAGLEAARLTGIALAELHAQSQRPMVISRRFSLASAAHVAAEAVAGVHPPLASPARSLARRIAALLEDQDTRLSHGDFYAEQVIVHGRSVSFLDFDRACLASPAADLGSFAGHLQAAVVRGLQSRDRADAAIESLRRGYDTRRPVPTADHFDAHTAVALLRLASEPFRRRQEGWAELTEAIVERAITLAGSARTPARPRSTFSRRTRSVLVDDPHGLASDPEWSFFHRALDPASAQRSLHGVLEQLGAGGAELREIRVTRLKPGRRCVLEYAFDSDRIPARRLVLIGKSRIKGVNENAQFALESLWNSGFRPGESDVCVPQPLGAVPAWGMTVQRKVDGRQADERLRDPDAPQTAARIADAIWMLHTRGTAPIRSYTLDDELRMLRARLVEVRERLGCARVDSVVRGCERLAANVPSTMPRPIHRDFYAAQVLVEPERIWLLDLDLYCSGDPALDVGNFLAHMIEERLRSSGSAEGRTDAEHAFESRYVALAGRRMLPSIRACTTLSLARHVYLSTQFPDRQHTTYALLDLCERRLSAGT